MEPAHDKAWRPLGQLLVERGLITEAQLEDALDEQAATGERLGEVLIRGGLVSGPDLTHALMEQLGVEVTTEEGFGSGLWAALRHRHRAAEVDEGAEVPSAPAEHEASTDEPASLVLVDRLYERLEVEVEQGPATPEEPPEPRGEIDELPALAPDPEPELDQGAEKEDHGPETEDEQREAAAREAELGVLGERIDATENLLLREREAHSETRRLLATALEELASGGEAVEATGHLLFVPNPDGYELIEIDGPAPALGVEVEHAATPFVVSKLGRSPLPLDRRPCAYLVPA